MTQPAIFCVPSFAPYVPNNTSKHCLAFLYVSVWADSMANPHSPASASATHTVRSGMNEPFVTDAGNARDDLVSDHSGFAAEADTYGLAV
jgi:hypothetical protein